MTLPKQFAFAILFALGLTALVAPPTPAATYGPEVRVQVIIDRITPDGRIKDALYFSKAEFEALTDGQVKALEDQRVESIRLAIEAAKTAPPPVVTKQDLEAEKAQLEARLAVLNAEIAKK